MIPVALVDHKEHGPSAEKEEEQLLQSLRRHDLQHMMRDAAIIQDDHIHVGRMHQRQDEGQNEGPARDERLHFFANCDEKHDSAED